MGIEWGLRTSWEEAGRAGTCVHTRPWETWKDGPGQEDTGLRGSSLRVSVAGGDDKDHWPGTA